MKRRNIRNEEIVIINTLLSKASFEKLMVSKETDVKDMDDGGMGSIYFIDKCKLQKNRKFGKKLIEAKYIDSDYTPVYFSLIIDADETLFELDIWRVDFNSLKKYPNPENLIFETP